MEPNTFSRIRLWCPRPLGSYSQNKPCCLSVKKSPPAGDARHKEGEASCSENTPPQAPLGPAGGGGAGDGQGEEGRVLLDTWYVIKPGNTKEKIAFFVAHQCGGGSTGRTTNAVKVKGNWSTDGTKPKRRRKSREPGQEGCPARPRERAGIPDRLCPCSGPAETEPAADPTFSVAEMVAQVERRAAASDGGSAPRGPVHPPPGPSEAQADAQELGPIGGSADTRRVAQAIARIEKAQRGGPGAQDGRRDGEGEGGAAGGGERAPCPAGEVRIAFRVASGDPRSQGEAQPPGPGPGCIFMSCNHTVCGGVSMEKITCDLYHIVSPSSSSVAPPDTSTINNHKHHHHSSLARSRSDVEMATAPVAEEPRKDGAPEAAGGASPAPAPEKGAPRDCLNGFHVEVVVTGGVDHSVFFGREGQAGDKEDTVCVTVSGPGQDAKCPACEDPPPGQLFFLRSLPQATGDSVEASADQAPGPSPDSKEKAVLLSPESDPQDAPLYCLYRHVSHDFLEIRFKIQRLLEPRQYLLLLPDHVTVKILSYLPTRALAALKCVCHHFKAVIEAYGVRATDSRWNRDPLYRDDPCKQCKKRYERGDVSLCRWHPKPYHHDLPYGRSYWMCCRRKDRDTPGCCIGLHDNNWVQPSDALKKEEGR
ncbi:F-box only protein 46 [Stegostoma tigrinum]|uniref:F-box only protein 46 n=1 Tax=Stegostoma tigrinum TaxID=3053191 RepID=UPI00202B0E55|nr:F-box only protein 46 [Stegostoma tigrinum]XP_048378536.1 F-box only protein 46 [Stegostoma tigrinum]XP_048378537.1 F-box only protein 46 [Stegostoma tigrinum]